MPQIDCTVALWSGRLGVYFSPTYHNKRRPMGSYLNHLYSWGGRGLAKWPFYNISLFFKKWPWRGRGSKYPKSWSPGLLMTPFVYVLKHMLHTYSIPTDKPSNTKPSLLFSIVHTTISYSIELFTGLVFASNTMPTKFWKETMSMFVLFNVLQH